MTEPHWRVVIDDRARKDLRRIDPPTRKRILTAGDWRVRFERDGRQLIITVVRVLPRGRAYDR